jgi:type I restriction enzyme, S subunit
MTKLKRVVVMRSGGTPTVDDASMWDEDGLPWVSIADMSKAPTVVQTERSVSTAGVAAKALPVGKPETLLFAMYASVGAVAVLGIEASWNQAILGMEPRPDLADARFVRYWLECHKPDLMAITRSNTQENLNAEQVGNLPFPLLTISAQATIADYLDRDTTRIDALIATKRRMVELLEERLALYTRKLLMSGSHPLRPLKRTWQVIDCKHRTPTYVDHGYPVISPGDATPGRLDITRAHRFVNEDDYRDLTEAGRRPRKGDIVYSRNASIGIAAFVDTDSPFCMGQDVCLISSDHASQLYLTHFLNSLGLDQLEEQKVGSTFSRVNIAQILELVVPTPHPDDQHHIARRLDVATNSQQAVVTCLDKQLEFLQERRQALITAAVTGQLDIAEAA